MRHAALIAGICVLAAAAFAPTAALSKGKGGGNAYGKSSVKVHSNKGGALRGLARADAAAGTHGLKGRNNARLHGANQADFCPPGQAKKPGLGSRFQC